MEMLLRRSFFLLVASIIGAGFFFGIQVRTKGLEMCLQFFCGGLKFLAAGAGKDMQAGGGAFSVGKMRTVKAVTIYGLFHKYHPFNIKHIICYKR